MASLVAIMWQIGTVKSMHVSECTFMGGLKEFVMHLIQDSLIGFWTVCMFINILSIHGRPLVSAPNYIPRITNASKIKYAMASTSGVAIILINSLTLKLNNSMCGEENYDQVEKAIYQK